MSRTFAYTSFMGKSMFMSAKLGRKDQDSTARRGDTPFGDDENLLLPELAANRFSLMSEIKEDPEEIAAY